MRGPLVYCFEEVDCGENLSALRLPRSPPIESECARISESVSVAALKAKGQRMDSGTKLYSDMPPEPKDVVLTAVPYYTWGNRGAGGMRVWLLE
jgi:DUF1680 family protein